MIDSKSQKSPITWGTSRDEGFPGSVIKNVSACNAGDRGDAGLISDREDPLEEKMATHSSILAWEIPRSEEPSRQETMGSQELDTN